MLYAGLDLGQRQDHSAIAVVERMNEYRAFETPSLHSLIVRHIERAPLGMPYPQVVERVKEVVRAGVAEGGCALAVDATGVGAPVVEMLRGALFNMKVPGCELAAVSITGGDRERYAGGVWNVPKKDLMAGLQVLLERGVANRARSGSCGGAAEGVDGCEGGDGRRGQGADGRGRRGRA